MKPQVLNLIAAVNAKNGTSDYTLVEEKDPAWLANTDLGDPANDAVFTTDGSTDDVHITGATYVVCWWKGSCVAVYFTNQADEAALLIAIQAGEPVELDSDPTTWDDGLDDDGDGTVSFDA